METRFEERFRQYWDSGFPILYDGYKKVSNINLNSVQSYSETHMTRAATDSPLIRRKEMNITEWRKTGEKNVNKLKN